MPAAQPSSESPIGNAVPPNTDQFDGSHDNNQMAKVAPPGARIAREIAFYVCVHEHYGEKIGLDSKLNLNNKQVA